MGKFRTLLPEFRTRHTWSDNNKKKWRGWPVVILLREYCYFRPRSDVGRAAGDALADPERGEDEEVDSELFRNLCFTSDSEVAGGVAARPDHDVSVTIDSLWPGPKVEKQANVTRK